MIGILYYYMQKYTIAIIIVLTIIVGYCAVEYVSTDKTTETHDKTISDVDIQHQADLDKVFNGMEDTLAKRNGATNDNDFIFNIENDKHNYIPVGELTISNETWSEHYNTTDEYILFEELDRNSTYMIESHGKVMKVVPDGNFTELTMFVI